MVEVVKISQDGCVLEIREVSDTYRDQLYDWVDEE